MNTHIACTDFEVTPAIREHVTNNLEAIDHPLRTEDVRVFLAHPGGREFTAVIKIHDQVDLIGRGKGEDLYHAVTEARRRLERQLSDRKGRKLHRRHEAKPALT